MSYEQSTERTLSEMSKFPVYVSEDNINMVSLLSVMQAMRTQQSKAVQKIQISAIMTLALAAEERFANKHTWI